MGRLRLALAAVVLAPAAGQAVEIAEGHNATIGIEAGYLHMSGLPSWTEGSVGKLRYDDDGLVLGRVYLDYRGRITDTLGAHVALEFYDDNLGKVIDYTEAYLEWRPVPRSATRYRFKLGTFYPRISLENTDPGWSSPYTLNSSAINTWVAEELRSTGLEFTVSRRPASLGGNHTFSFTAAAFMVNDPAGGLLAWKGWSVHDRQTRPSDNLPLAPLPQIVPGGIFDGRQELWIEPLQEVDNDVGYSLNVEWRFGNRVLVRAMHFNNKGDPRVIEDLQYGWLTRFDHLGVRATLPGDVGLFAQWMDGSTEMGPLFRPWRPVDVEYASWYLMLTRAFGKHRVSARYDDFEITDIDQLPMDENAENGYAWTLNYQYSFDDRFTLALEWLSIRTHRPAWNYFDLADTATERQTQLTLRARF